MQLFPVGVVYNFMKYRRILVGFSLLMVLASLALLAFKGPRLGTDFVGGTEIELAFPKPITGAELRKAVQASGFASPDVIKVEDPLNPQRFLVRVQEVSTIDENSQRQIEQRLCFGEQTNGCSAEHQASEVKFSPGGDKISARFNGAPDLDWIRERMRGLKGIRLRPGKNNPSLQNVRDHKVEIQLMSKGDQLMDGLRQHLGAGVVPEQPLRTEWIGPKAGAQLRDAAIKSVAIALVFIMAYVAFRFDLRFAPGGALALAHDAIVTLGVLTLFGKEINLTTVAAILTIIGYSVNDTVVVFDRVRENMGRMRGTSFFALIDLSLSEMMSRTVLTSGTTIFSLVCFFVWGTGTLKDFAFTLIIGLVLGTYSSIYVALPLTESLDRRFFGGGKRAGKPAAATS